MYTSCYYYYNTSSDVDVGAIVGGVIGGTIALFIIIGLICHFKRQRDYEAHKQMEIMNKQNKT